eukprot:CAMPEP_0114490596 /NCGR_PEP_ID=MMETSP0109-20121206/2530_1 /TAXON_ID=29199 /ORGANISM="Chlorarachnion reptans, Strain CCCM449" /LENGTH=431 /DNA_ID=CAMNT_0001667231 /DNA_START=267 /DNA_END=1562 /DNA_ORIENTATION=-
MASSHDAPIPHIAIENTHSRFMLSIDLHGNLNMFDLERGASQFANRPKGGDGDSKLFDRINDSSFLASSLDGNENKRHALVPKKYSPTFRLKASLGALRYCCWYPPDPGMFITGGFDQRVRIWDTNATKKLLDQYNVGFPIRCCEMPETFGSNHSLIAACGEAPVVRLCDSISGSITHTLIGHSANVFTLAWSPTQAFTLLTGGDDSTIRAWDIRKGKWFMAFDQERTLDSLSSNRRATRRIGWKRKRDREAKRNIDVPRAHSGCVTCIKFARDGRRLFSTGQDGRLRSWQSDGGCELFVHFEHTGNGSRILRFDVSEYDHCIAYPDRQKVKLYGSKTGRVIQVLNGHFETPLCCAFRIGTQELYTAGTDHQILAWCPEAVEKEMKEAWNEVRRQRQQACNAESKNPFIDSLGFSTDDDNWSDDSLSGLSV